MVKDKPIGSGSPKAVKVQPAIPMSGAAYPALRSVKKDQRVLGEKYIDGMGRVGTWDGELLRCEHYRRRSKCKDCGGPSICQHQRQKAHCKDCGGSQICPHGRQKAKCKDCGGSQICIHQRQKVHCKECGGSQICEHRRQRHQCKECSTHICEHNKKKIECKDCRLIAGQRRREARAGATYGTSAPSVPVNPNVVAVNSVPSIVAVGAVPGVVAVNVQNVHASAIPGSVVLPVGVSSAIPN